MLKQNEVTKTHPFYRQEKDTINKTAMLKEARNSQRIMTGTELILQPIHPNDTLQNRNLVRVGVASAANTMAAINRLSSPRTITSEKVGNTTKVNRNSVSSSSSRHLEARLQDIAMTDTSAKLIKQSEYVYINRWKRSQQERSPNEKMETCFLRESGPFNEKRDEAKTEKKFAPKSKPLARNESRLHEKLIMYERSSVKDPDYDKEIPEFDKMHLKKDGGNIGRNVVYITKMKTTVQII